MSETPFQKFIDLITFDQSTLATEKSIAQLNQEIVDLNTQEKNLSQRFEKIKTNAIDARKKVDSIELDIKELDAADRAKKERLENSTDYKHYQSLKSEIEHLKNKQAKLEENLLEAWHQLEACQKELEFAKSEIANKHAEIVQQLDQKKINISALQSELEKRAEERPEKEKLIPEEWLTKYSMMRSRVPNPVVPVFQGACGACFYRITEQDLIQLRRRQLLQCKGCFRLLYSEEFEKESEPVQ